MSLHMLKEAEPRSPPGWVRFRRLFSSPDEGEAVLAHQELMG